MTGAEEQRHRWPNRRDVDHPALETEQTPGSKIPGSFGLFGWDGACHAPRQRLSCRSFLNPLLSNENPIWVRSANFRDYNYKAYFLHLLIFRIGPLHPNPLHVGSEAYLAALSKNMLLQLRMRTLRVAFKCGEPSNSGVQHVEVLRYRQIMHIVESLNTFNFDLAQTLIHRIHARVVGGCVVVSGAGGRIDRHRGQAMAKRVHSRTRFAFLSLRAAAFRGVALVCGHLPL